MTLLRQPLNPIFRYLREFLPWYCSINWIISAALAPNFFAPLAILPTAAGPTKTNLKGQASYQASIRVTLSQRAFPSPEHDKLPYPHSWHWDPATHNCSLDLSEQCVPLLTPQHRQVICRSLQVLLHLHSWADPPVKRLTPSILSNANDLSQTTALWQSLKPYSSCTTNLPNRRESFINVKYHLNQDYGFKS